MGFSYKGVVMGKKETYRDELKPHFDAYLKSGESGRLREIIETSSNLPGPRANLEFAAAFADSIAEKIEDSAD